MADSGVEMDSGGDVLCFTGTARGVSIMAYFFLFNLCVNLFRFGFRASRGLRVTRKHISDTCLYLQTYFINYARLFFTYVHV